MDELHMRRWRNEFCRRACKPSVAKTLYTLFQLLFAPFTSSANVKTHGSVCARRPPLGRLVPLRENVGRCYSRSESACQCALSMLALLPFRIPIPFPLPSVVVPCRFCKEPTLRRSLLLHLSSVLEIILDGALNLPFLPATSSRFV
jgi:hypothetical protein